MLNGANLGPIYGFTQTRFDVSGVLNPAGINTLVVTLDDRLTEDTVPGGPTSGFVQADGPIAYTFPIAWANRPGIIRGVSLVYSQLPVITDVYVQQSFDATMENLTLSVLAATGGSLSLDANIQVTVGRAGSLVGSCKGVLTSDGGLGCQIQIANPALWSPGNPVLHDVAVTLSGSGGTLDAGTDRVGFRRFEARGSRFYLNNKPIFLRGISRHDIYNNNGFVADDATVQGDLIRIKSLGVNYIRSIHYPPDESVARYADQYGLLLSEELPAWANFQSVTVVNTAATMLRSLLRRDYNRASVVIYELASVNADTAPDYLSALVPIGKQYDPSRLYSFIRDDGSDTAEQIQANAAYVQEKNLDFYSQNAYWFSGIYQAVAPALPTAVPFLATEWTGGEGSNRGPIGKPGTQSFPSNTGQTDGNYPESDEATQMSNAFAAFLPYLCTDANPSACVAGVVYFNWQDVEWPGMGYFYGGHFDYDRNGLVYEDRTSKDWPMAIFSMLMAQLPQ
jgi:beta-glucuronidase